MKAESFFHYKDILIILGAAGIVIPVLLRFGINSILGFLIVGLVLGPYVLGNLIHFIPAFQALSLGDLGNASGLAELGVVFLLFLIGLELSFERLKTMRRLVFGLGGLQVLLSSLGLGSAAYWLGFTMPQSAVIGMALGLSSTAIIIQLLSDQKRLGTQAGRFSFAVLLMQDVAVIPMLLVVTALAAPTGTNITLNLAWALAQATMAAILIVVLGRYLLTPLLRLVAASKSPELFMAVVLFITVGTGAAATLAGLSMSLGAFIAGLVLAETEFRRAIETILEPFKGLLLGLFFLLVGLNLELNVLVQKPVIIISATVAILALKAGIVLGLGVLFKLPKRSVFEAALLLAPGGEFAFVMMAAATTAGLFTKAETAPTLLVVTISMMLIPALSYSATRLRGRFEIASPQHNEPAPEPASSHIIIAGFGRVGTMVADMLNAQSIPYIAIDFDMANVTRGRKANYKVYYGDASQLAFLHSCGIDQANALAITMDAPSRVELIVKTVRADQPHLKIIARARDERHAQKLYELGVSEAVPETIEASLQLVEALLVEVGVPMGLAIAAVHERRDQSRKLLGREDRRAQVAKARTRLAATKKP
jgi:Kef-type K+ transport system membrane component KefB